VDRDVSNVSEDFGLVGFALCRCRFGNKYTLTVRADVIDDAYTTRRDTLVLLFTK